MHLPFGLRVFVMGLGLWCHLQMHWFSGSFRLQAVGVVLLLYWVLGCLVVYTREKAGGEERVDRPPQVLIHPFLISRKEYMFASNRPPDNASAERIVSHRQFSHHFTKENADAPQIVFATDR
jgi:hypothetical protein